MNKDDNRTIAELARKLGRKHFSMSKAWQTLCPKQHPMPSYHSQDWIESTMRRAVRAGLAIETIGPRGGKGWTLTNEAMNDVIG